MASGTELNHAELVSRFLSEDIGQFTRFLAAMEKEVEGHATPHSERHLARLTEATDAGRDACTRLEMEIGDDEDQLRAAQAAYRHAIAPWFDQSWFMHRAKVKPMGYPGDYLILNAIYDRLPKSSGIGGYLDLYFLNTELGRAVCTRLKAARDFVLAEIARRSGDVSLLNIACGPCREYAEGLPHPPNVHPSVTCIDAEPEALDFVRDNVAVLGNGTPDLNCVQYNALKMSSTKRNIKHFGRPDVIYSIGLFDYLTDRHLVPMLRGLRESLAEDGVLYVAFKDGDRYNKTIYHWMADWFFLYRSVDDCRRLYEQAGFDMNALDMTRDDTGIIINFIARVGHDTVYRVDGAQETPERERQTALETAPENAG